MLQEPGEDLSYSKVHQAEGVYPLRLWSRDSVSFIGSGFGSTYLRLCPINKSSREARLKRKNSTHRTPSTFYPLNLLFPVFVVVNSQEERKWSLSRLSYRRA